MFTKNAAHTVHFKCFIKYVSINYCIHIKGGYVKVSCLKICNIKFTLVFPVFKSNIQTSGLRKKCTCTQKADIKQCFRRLYAEGGTR